jgi:hypothetical protein
MSTATFTATLTLPDGFYFNEKAKTYINNGDYSTTRSNYSGYVTVSYPKDKNYVYGEVDPMAFAYVSISSGGKKCLNADMELAVVSDNQLQITWSWNNLLTDGNDISLTLHFDSEMILTDPATLQSLALKAGGDSMSFDFTADVTVKQEFLYGGEVTTDLSATMTKEIKSEIYAYSQYDTSADFGQDDTISAFIRNESLLPYSTLAAVSDDLPNWRYIKPENIEKMLMRPLATS